MKSTLFFFCMFFWGATLGAQTKNDSIPVNKSQIDSTELLIDLLSKDSLVYRPEGDPLIVSLIKQNNLRAMEFLLLHCHERPDVIKEGEFGSSDPQHFYIRLNYIEYMIENHGDKWIFMSALSNVINEREFSDDRLNGLCSILRHFFTRPTYKSIFLEMERFAPPLALKNISKIKTKLNI